MIARTHVITRQTQAQKVDMGQNGSTRCSMSEKPPIDVTATASIPLSGREIDAAIDALIAKGHPLETLTKRQVWREVGNRGSLETVSKWVNRYRESRVATSGPGTDDGAKSKDGPAVTSATGSEGAGAKSESQNTGTSNAGEDAKDERYRAETENHSDPEGERNKSATGAVIAFIQQTYQRDITTLKDSHQRECTLLREQTEDRVARARAEEREAVNNRIARNRKYAVVGVICFCAAAAGTAAWSGFQVGRAEGGVESQKVIGEWIEMERARALVAPVAPTPPLQVPAGNTPDATQTPMEKKALTPEGNGEIKPEAKAEPPTAPTDAKPATGSAAP